MKKLLALITARNKEFYRDRSAMGWTLLFPFIVLLGFTYGYSGKQDPILRIAVTPDKALEHKALQTFGKLPGIEFKGAAEETAALKRLSRYETDLSLSLDVSAEQPKIIYSFNGDSDKGKLAEQLLVHSVSNQAASLEPRKVEGKRVRYSDWILPGLLAMNIMFGSMFGVGYVIVRYRKNGVLKRLRATPLSALQFLTAQVISRMMLMVVTAWVVLLGSMILIGFKPQGSWLDLTAFLMVSAIAMISLGLLVAARITNEEVADGVLNLMTWPMIFLSGIWFSVDGASDWVIWTAKAMPLSHVVHGLRAILIEGATLSQLYPQVGILLVLAALFVAISAFVFRWR